MSETRKAWPDANAELLARVRAAARQEQFLDVVSAEEARARFERHLDLSPLPAETVPLAAALTRVLAHDVVAAVDAPPFDRSNVDGFARRCSLMATALPKPANRRDSLRCRPGPISSRRNPPAKTATDISSPAAQRCHRSGAPQRLRRGRRWK